MEKEFLNSLRALHERYTRIVDGCDDFGKPSEIISKAKHVLEKERSDIISDDDIKRIEDMTLVKFSKDLQKLDEISSQRKLCQRRNFLSEFDYQNVPNPRKKSIFTSTEHKSDVVKILDEILKEAEKKGEEKDVGGPRKENEGQVMEELVVPATKIESTPLSVVIKKIGPPRHETPLFEPPQPPNLHKFFQKWKTFTKNSLKRKSTDVFKTKIDNFLGNLQETIRKRSSKSMTDLNCRPKTDPRPLKSKSSIQFSESQSFLHRFQAQKDIIEMQKQQLREQKKLIDEITLVQIQEQAKESLEKCREIYQKTAMDSKQFRYKVKVIKEEDYDDPNNPNAPPGPDFSLKPSKPPKIVQVMEDRAKEREERRLLIQERKRLLDEAKKRQAEELIQKKKIEEIEEKNKRLLALKEQREIQRQIELKKKLEKREYLINLRKALLHYRKKLLEGTVRAMKRAVEERQTQEEIACRFFEFNTSYKFFRYWKFYARERVKGREEKADEMYRVKKLEESWGIWKKFHQDNVRKLQVAQDIYDLKLQSRFFKDFHRVVCFYHVQHEVNLETARNHHRRQVLFTYFNRWQALPAVNRIERSKDERRRKWRQKVMEILPDYNPIRDD